MRVGEVVNVGSDEEISIKGLAQIVKKRTGANRPSITFPTIRHTSLALRTCSAVCPRSRSSRSLLVFGQRLRLRRLLISGGPLPEEN